jgi:hypothetical protein
MLLSSAEQEVLAAAEELGGALCNAQQEQSQFRFDSLLLRCNDAISEELGVDYGDACGDACGVGDSC